MKPLSVSFRYTPILGGYERGVTRRDPSPVVRADGLYHVWYSRSVVASDGYAATVWHAASSDGVEWAEQDEAVGKGGSGDFDEHGVFTPTILVADSQYCLFYTAVPEPFTNDDGGPRGTKTAIGVAVADSPDGPWRKFEGNPVLRPSDSPGDFDSHRVDDSCMIVREGQYWMYHKGRQAGLTPGQTKMGLAIAERPTGPYVKFPGNPVLDSGHEVCVWPHGTGVASIIAPTGPEGNTLQYSGDGVHFQRVCQVEAPRAPGPFREDNFRGGTGPGITWGVCMKPVDWPYLMRFDCDLTASETSEQWA